jgi:hypothetical protein
MKKIILFLMAGIVTLSLSSCGAHSVEIAQNEQGLYGLKQGSKWIAEPVYVKMVSLQSETAGTFFVGKRVPSTQKYYHVLFDSNGKLLKECNIYNKILDFLEFVTPGEYSSSLELSTMKERFGSDITGVYIFEDIFAEE